MNRASVFLRAGCCLGLLMGLSSTNAIRGEQASELRKRLHEPSPAVRQQAALTLAEANDAAAIPPLIDLLAELPADECKTIEEYLTQLAGPWLPSLPAADNSASARKSRRDAWMKWWRSGDGKAQLATIQQHVPTPQLRRQTKMLIDQLGDDDFAVREKAHKELLRLGRVALPQLRQAKASGDPEMVRRARDLIERLENDPKAVLPRAAVRLTALHKPVGAAAVLLAYCPHAEEDNLGNEVQAALTALALRDGKPDVTLLRALDDESPLVRAAAGEALAQGGGREGRKAVRKLLADKAPSVRLRVARALVRMGEKDGVPVLIELLAVLPDTQLGEAEEVLYQLAGDAPPKAVDDNKKRRDSWAAWWKINAERIDLNRASGTPQLGYTLLCDTDRGRVFEIDRRGKERWSLANLQSPGDAVVLPTQRVLIAEFAANRVSERDFTGKILWQKKVSQPVGVQRLANGNTFILSYEGIIREVNRDGKEVYSISNVQGGVRAAYRGRNGVIFCITQQGECVQMDTKGKRLRSFPTNHPHGDVGGLDLLPNGRLLISPQGGAKLMVYTVEGKMLYEVEAPQAATATGLPNGHFLVPSYQSKRVYEVDRSGKIVWEQKGVGHVYRARRR